MRVQRHPSETRNFPTLRQVKTRPTVSEGCVSSGGDFFETQAACSNSSEMPRIGTGSFWRVAALLGTVATAWAALSGHPVLAGGLALSTTVASGVSAWRERESQPSGRVYEEPVNSNETPIWGGFTVSSDHQRGTVKVTAADGTSESPSSRLVNSRGAYRLQAQNPMGSIEQLIFPNEVLLNFKNGDRIISLQHESGCQPVASTHDGEELLTAGDDLKVRMDATGNYQVGEGASSISIRPLLPLSFLERRSRD